jgi:DNA-binding beta-propeller fold protein YncE
MLSVIRMSAILIAAAIAGCGDPSVTEVIDPEQYLDELPAYPEAPEAYDRALEGATFDYGSAEVCSTTTYEIGDAPEEVVMFNTDPQVFWPGALIQGDSYENGSPLLIPLPNRAPLDLSIQGLYAAHSSAQDVTPTQSAVTEAIGGLLAGAVQDGTPATQSVFFNQKEAYSFEQGALKLGFSARYLGTRVKGSLSYSTTSEQSTVMANATIRTFTISVDQPPTPSDFFDGLSAEELDEQIALGRLSENNLPVYVASVTYGQIMMFSATSTSSMSELKGALSASFNSFAGGGAAGVSTEQQDVLRGSEITVVTLGGSEEGVAGLIRDGNPSRFFEGSSVVTSSVPIAYTLKDLNGNIVKVGESSRYDLTTCQPNGFANFYVANRESGIGTVAGYYADGTEAELEREISGFATPRSIAYDSLDDLLYVLSSNNGSSLVDVYEANGLRPYNDQWEAPRNASGITYDPNHARIYATGDFGGGHVLAAYNPNGDALNIPFYSELADPTSYNEEVWVNAYAAAYDTTRDRIYVALQVGGYCHFEDCTKTFTMGTVLAFDFQGNEIELEGDFEGLADPRGIAYDPSLDRIYVSDALAHVVRVFDDQGQTIELPQPIENLSTPLGLYFDSTYNRLYVVNAGSSVITVYEPNGSPAQGLAVPAFPKLNGPTAIAFRPF